MIACQCIQAQRIREQLQTANEPFISFSTMQCKLHLKGATIHGESLTAIAESAPSPKPKVQYCHVHAKKQMIACQCIQAQRIHEQLQTANEPFISISAMQCNKMHLKGAAIHVTA